MPPITNDWAPMFEPEYSKPYYKKLYKQIIEEYNGNNIYEFTVELKDLKVELINCDGKADNYEVLATVDFEKYILGVTVTFGFGIFIFQLLKRGGSKNGNMGLNDTKVEADLDDADIEAMIGKINEYALKRAIRNKSMGIDKKEPIICKTLSSNNLVPLKRPGSPKLESMNLKKASFAIG